MIKWVFFTFFQQSIFGIAAGQNSEASQHFCAGEFEETDKSEAISF